MNKYFRCNRVFSIYCCLIFAALVISGCSSQPVNRQAQAQNSEQVKKDVDSFFVIDCLLPGQIRQLGQSFTYQAPRRAIKTSALDCEIRGGEYVAYDRADYATALKVWLPLAKEGDAEAQTYVGEIYEKGLGLQSDYALAAKWYKKAADQGYSRAQIDLGYLYEKGLGVEQDLVESLNWYRKASGLEDDDLAFASTVETAVRTEYEEEIGILRSELQRSENEITALQEQLAASQKQLDSDRSRLAQERLKAEQARKQLEQRKISPDADNTTLELERLENELRLKEAKIAEQYAEVKLQEAKISKQDSQLTEKLKKAEQRAEQLSTELSKQKGETATYREQLSLAQAQLSWTQQTLSRLRGEFQTEKTKIGEEKQRLSALQAGKVENNNQLVEKLETQLAQREQELEKQRRAATQLEAEKERILRDKAALQSGQNSALSQSTNELEQLGAALEKRTQELSEQRARIELLEQQKRNLENQRDQSVAGKDQTISQLQEQLDEREKAHEQQRLRIAQLDAEKQRVEKKLNDLKTTEPSKLAFAIPTIEILEPPFTLTRGMPTIKLRSPMRQREITGRVTAPAGLMTLTVNDRNEKVNESGLFQSMIDLMKSETSVKTVAVDKAGNMASLEFVLVSPTTKPDQKPLDTLPGNNLAKGSDVEFGPYHALIIANQDYQHLPTLDTPINDGKTIENILKQKYGFNTRLLTNANRYEVLSALNEMRAKLTELDNLLIYYAGHGELDQVNLRGHWLPVDAESENTANWISTIAITDVLNAMSAKQVLVVADSCYSGAMTRASLARLEPGMSESLRTKWLKVMSKTRSRTVLTSGGLKPVLDSGANGHSIFANAFIEAISKNDGVLEGQQLYRKISDQMREVTSRLNFPQTPQYAPIKHGGHESGDFFLISSSRESLAGRNLTDRLP